MTPSRSNLVLLNLVKAKCKKLTLSEYKFISHFKTVPTPKGAVLVYETELFGQLYLCPVQELPTEIFNKLHMIANVSGRTH